MTSRPSTPSRAQDDLERSRTGAHRDRVLRAVPRRERGFELGADRAQCELPGGERFVDAREDLGPVFGWEKDSGRRDAHGRRIYRWVGTEAGMKRGPDRGLFASSVLRTPTMSRSIRVSNPSSS